MQNNNNTHQTNQITQLQQNISRRNTSSFNHSTSNRNEYQSQNQQQNINTYQSTSSSPQKTSNNLQTNSSSDGNYIQQNALIQIKMERQNISLILKKSPLFKNPIIFMILLDLITIIVTIVETVHIKQNVTDGYKRDSSQYQTYQNYFYMSIILIVIMFTRMFIMIISECIRSKKYSSRVEVKHNHQVLIFIIRYLFTTLTILPFMMYSYLDGKLQDLSFWIPCIILIVQEVPGLVFVIYLSVCKDKEIQRYIKRQDQIAKEIIMKQQSKENKEENDSKGISNIDDTNHEYLHNSSLRKLNPDMRRRSNLNNQTQTNLSIAEISQEQCVTSSQFLNISSSNSNNNNQTMIQDDFDSLNLKSTNLNIKQQQQFQQLIDNKNFRDLDIMPAINLGKLSRKDSLNTQSSSHYSQIKASLGAVGSRQINNNNTNNKYDIQQHDQQQQQNRQKNHFISRKNSFQTAAPIGRLNEINNTYYNGFSVPFQVPIIQTNNSNTNNDNDSQSETDFFSMSRDRVNSMPLNHRVNDPTNRLRLFMNNPSSNQLDSIMEEVTYNNQTLQIPKYGSFNVRRQMPSQQFNIKDQYDNNNFEKDDITTINNQDEDNDLESSLSYQQQNIYGLHLNNNDINLRNENFSSNIYNNYRKRSDCTYNSEKINNNNNNSNDVRSGTTREKSAVSNNSSRISESWSPNDRRVANMNRRNLQNNFYNNS